MDQTGHLHSLSAESSVIGVTGGYKWRGKKKQFTLEHFCAETPDKYDSLFIDLSGTGWAFLQQMEWQDTMVYETAKPPRENGIEFEDVFL